MKYPSPFLAALPLFASACSAPSASVIPRYGDFGLDGHFSASAGGGSASSSFDDLGLDDTVGAFTPRVDLSFSGFDLSLSVLSTSFDGSGTTDGALEIDGVTIPGNTDVDTDMKFDTYSGTMTWDFIPSDLVDFGLGVGVTVIHFDMKLEEQFGTADLETDETVPIPLVAARGSVDIGDFEIVGTVGYMDITIDGNDISFLDYDVALQYHLFGGAERAAGHIVIGYRGFDVDAKYDDGNSDIEADFTLDGPYAGLSISF